MDNPGQDKFNVDADDVLAPKRQKEIVDVLDKVAAYGPTKIALEADYKTQAMTREYADFLKRKYQLARDERNQIGFALAKRLGHTSIYPVDFPMWMDGRVPAEIGSPKPKPSSVSKEEASNSKEEPPAIFQESERLMKTSTVLEYLRFLNSDRYIQSDSVLYMSLLKPAPYSDSLYGNADLLTNWYKRNFRIFTNINRIAEPNDRILLLIGAGHQKILRDLAAESPDICLLDTEAYLR
ncbi:MAG TPA: DUF5694 domain-containing protein [Terriglobales bacterium]|nr:DUF5694 domain-containing protein [Terriglobales bacterium]